MPNKEIEIKMLFKSKNKIIALLRPDIKFKKKVALHDTYFGPQKFDMSNKNDLMRIREEKNGKTELTFKSKAKDRKNIWHRIELSININSPANMAKILEHINFKKISEYKSIKEYYNFKNLEICFAHFTLPTKLEFMEIEGKSEKEIRSLVQKIGNRAREVGEEIFDVFDKVRKK
jgi:predicted adenylyl cyclase CyaB